MLFLGAYDGHFGCLVWASSMDHQYTGDLGRQTLSLAALESRAHGCVVAVPGLGFRVKVRVCL
jgi:hypothetical protein